MTPGRATRAFLPVVLAMVLAALAAACSSSHSPATPSGTTTAASLPSHLPFAPPVTPTPGQPFVGYWRRDKGEINPIPAFYEILHRDQGYEVSYNGQPPLRVPLKDGRLVLQTLHETPTAGGAYVRAGLELAWEKGTPVLYVKQSAEIPWLRQPLTRIDSSAYLKGVYAAANRATLDQLLTLAAGVSLWAEEHGQVPPAPSEMHPGSAFDQWLAKKARPSTWVWPTNPFSGRPMANNREPGDFTYVVNGDRCTMAAHLSGGRSVGVLK
jgi:hypothetical protein